VNGCGERRAEFKRRLTLREIYVSRPESKNSMSDDVSGPDTRRAVLALLCVFGLVAASTAAPAIAGDTPLGGLDSPRAPSDVPDFLLEMDALDWLFGDAPPEVPGGESLFGALNPGRSTSVGGAIPESARLDATQPHFVATASERTYWRTGAYIQYTGSGWKDRGNRAPYDPTRQGSEGWDGPKSEYTVELKRSATALPVVWRPLEIDPDCGEDNCDAHFERTQTGSLRVPSGLDAGSTYDIVASKPPRSEDILTPDWDQSVGNLSDDTYSESVPDAYTRVFTTTRVRSLASRVTDDATNRYEKAKAVERYLESEKSYSLSNGTASGDKVTDQFLFENNAGYCEHFATSMVTMLRTQDVPARYVVGYAGGERVGEDRYLVRGADAHAWVEVYFEDVGWVRFDPTPGGPRQAADDRLRGNSTYNVRLNQTATPGQDVTATVTTAGSSVSGVGVTVNGERVGVTDESGEVTFTVPYAEELDVELQRVDTIETTDVETNAVSSVEEPVAIERANGVLSGDAGVANVPPPRFAQDDGDGNESAHTFPVNADVRFQFQGDVEPGTTVTMQAFVGDQRFPDASIRVAGEHVGRTDERGLVDVPVPEDAEGVIEITASRGDITRTATYPVDGLAVSVSPSLVAPVPWTEATAQVTSGGEAVTDSVVELDGEVVGRTDENGNVQFEIPTSRVPAVSASANEKHAVTYVDGVLPTLAVIVLAALGSLAGVAITARRRGVTARGVASMLVRALNEAAALAIRTVVGFADALDELAAEFREATRDGWRGVLEWLVSLPGRIHPPNVRAWLAAALAAVRTERPDSTTATWGSERNASSGPAGRLQSVWLRFISLVGVERWETKTPGEVARRAVRSGFPRRPVYALTNAFRDAAYGGRSEGENAERARSALDELDGPDEASDGRRDAEPEQSDAEGGR
jgi:transglutaminase-like putative cysteine protease